MNNSESWISQQEPICRQLSRSDAKICTATFSQLPIYKLDDHRAEQVIRRVIARSATLTGASLPTDQALSVMIPFIKDHYSGFTPAEMMLAFELNLTGESWTKVEHFQIFSTDFFSQVLNNFRSRKAQAMIEFNKKSAELKKEIEPPKPSPEKMYLGLVEYFNQHNEPPAAWDFSSAFSWAYANRLFQESDEEMKKWFDIKSAEIRSQISLQIASSSNFIERQSLELKKSDSYVKLECRKLWMINFLKNRQFEK